MSNIPNGPAATIVNRPLVLDSDGVYSQLLNGAIINAGGTSGTSFTVGGRGLLFDDGSSSAGAGVSSLTLQTVYNYSPTNQGTAGIQLAIGKDFVITDSVSDGHFLRIDSITGKTTITGDLEVLGNSTTINTIIQNSDHWLVQPSNPTVTPIRIEPAYAGASMVDLMTVRAIQGGTPVFSIDRSGNLVATLNLTVGGLINNVDIVKLRSDVDNHLAGAAGFRHQASQVDILPIVGIPAATNVQQALAAVTALAQSGGSSGIVKGFEYIQNVTDTLWTVVHNLNSTRIQTTIYDTNGEVVLPGNIKIIDSNTVLITFVAPMFGKAIILAF